MNTIRNHRDLEAWQVAMELTTETYRLTGDLSVERNVRFAVADAACRALEYRGRAGAASGCRCQPPVIAGGSLAELDTQLEVAIRLKYLVEDAVLEFRRLHESSRRLVFGLRRSKRAQLVGAAAKSASVFLFVFYTFSQILS